MKFAILNLPSKWKEIYKYHENLGLPTIDPALQIILEEKLDFLESKKKTFAIASNRAIEDITGVASSDGGDAEERVPLFGVFCLFQSDPFTACDKSDYYRFYGHFYCKEPNRDQPGGHVQLTADYDEWTSRFQGRKFTGPCKPVDISKIAESPTFLPTPNMSPRPEKPQILPEFHQSAASAAHTTNTKNPTTSTLHWARQFLNSSASSANTSNKNSSSLHLSETGFGSNTPMTANESHQNAFATGPNFHPMHPFVLSHQQQMSQNLNFLQMQQGGPTFMPNLNSMHPFVLSDQQQMRQQACMQQMAHNQYLFQQQQAQCQLQMQQAQAIHQAQCIQQLQQAQCLQQMQGGTPFNGFCQPSQMTNPTGIIFPNINVIGQFY